MEFAKMKQDLWQYLPAELMINILSRLPFGTIILCKYVCKPWLDLIKSCEFGKHHLSNSKPIPGLAIFEDSSRQFYFYKFVDEHEHEHERERDEMFWRHFSKSLILKFSLPAHLKYARMRDSSVNGLLLFYDPSTRDHFVCNPLTRDYMRIPSSDHACHYAPYIYGDGFGFGVSKLSGEYKVVRVFSNNKCEVYTLGTRSWRSVAPCSYHHTTTATFLNGNLHWLLHDSYSSYETELGISCFDLETELFTLFSPPPGLPVGYSVISALEDCLAFNHNTGWGLVIWLMKEYGNDKSWTRKFIISINVPGDLGYGVVIPIKVFEDGEILIAKPCYSRLVCYLKKTVKTIQFPYTPNFYGFGTSRIVSYTPSFLPLKTFSEENISSY